MTKNRAIGTLAFTSLLLLSGCGANTASDATPTPKVVEATPTPSAAPEGPVTKEGYTIVNRGNDEGMVDGVFKHDHELDFANFVGDYAKANSTSPGKICSYLEANPNAVLDYAASNGEVISEKKSVTWDSASSLDYQAQMIDKITQACPATVAKFTGE